MGKFASKAPVVPKNVRTIVSSVPSTVNKAGGPAYRMSPHFQLVFLMMTNFLEDQFYRTANDTQKTIDKLIIAINDDRFVAQAAVYVRHVYGMRSVTHYVAAQIAKRVKGETWTKDFFNKVIYRVDDATEILSAYIHLFGRAKIPNSLKKGLALGLGKFDRYQIAKYRGEGQAFKLVDVVNLVHPRPTAKNHDALAELVAGTLKSEDTWEAMLSAAGQAGSKHEKDQNKARAWKDLVLSGKIPYLALLRNLRNILESCDDATATVVAEVLSNEHLIKKAKVFPFQYLMAIKAIKEIKVWASSAGRKIQAALNKAMEISLSNVPKFEGSTLVVIDASGSMTSATLSKKGQIRCSEIAALFGSVIAKVNDADMLLFDTGARYVNYPFTDSLATITEAVHVQIRGGGTDFPSIFKTANKKYDNIVILSDMQGWMHGDGLRKAYGDYCIKYKADPRVYSFDLQGLGTVQFPQNNIYCLAGFSDKTLELMGKLAAEPQAVLEEVRAVTFN